MASRTRKELRDALDLTDAELNTILVEMDALAHRVGFGPPFHFSGPEGDEQVITVDPLFADLYRQARRNVGR
jgi:hypothetical protein